MNKPQDPGWTARLPVVGQDQIKAARQAQAQTPPPPAQPEAPLSKGQELRLYLKGAGEWGRIHLRRWAHLLHGASAGTLAVGPVSFLLVAGALGTALTLCKSNLCS